MKKLFIALFALTLVFNQVWMMIKITKLDIVGSRTDNSGWDLVAGNGYFDGKVAVATTTFNGTLNLYSTGTTTIDIGTSSTTSIACLRTKNNSDSGYGYTSFQNGTPSSTVASKCGY